VESGRNESKSVSIILDTERNIAMAIVGFLPTNEEASIPLWQRAKEKMSLTGVTAEFIPAGIDRPFTKDTPQFERTTELVGKRVQFTYSSKDAYEHVYLNDHYFTWHCISGNEKGLADTDVANYFKLDKNLYLFSWQEKIIPTLGVVMEDFDRMRSYGKICGYEGFNFGKMINFPVGSYAKELNETEYDYSGLEKP
jgi:hypothetical protein